MFLIPHTTLPMNLPPLLSQINLPASWGVIVLGLVTIAFAIVAHALAAEPGKRPSWRETLGWSTSLLWALPVVIVLALVVGRAAPRFHESAPSSAEVPEPAVVILHRPDEARIDEGIVLGEAELTQAEKDAAKDALKDAEKVSEPPAVPPTRPADDIANDGVAVAELPASVAGAATVAADVPPVEPNAAKPDSKPDSLLKKAAKATGAAVKKLVGKGDVASEAATVGSPSPGVARRDRAADLPDWVRDDGVADGDKTLVVLSSKEHPTLAEAEAEVKAKALARVRRDFQQAHAAPVDWTVPEAAIHFRLAHEEKIARKAGNVSFVMFRVHRQLELSPVTREAAYEAWRGAVVEHRVWGLGGVFATLTLIAAASAAYLRLDARTQGECRGRLKTAAVGAIVAGGLLAANLL